MNRALKSSPVVIFINGTAANPLDDESKELSQLLKDNSIKHAVVNYS